MRYALRLTENQHKILERHLFPGDGLEAVALLLCGRRKGKDRHAFIVHEISLVPYEACEREAQKVTWSTDFLDPLISKAYGHEFAVIKIHSHPTGFKQFSYTDDLSDHGVFASIHSLLGDDLPHGSVVMLPDGSMFGRVLKDGEFIASLESIMTIGEDIIIQRPDAWIGVLQGFTKRHAQAFGRGTTELLRSLSIAVVGCSGTGSIVVELLARLGVGHLVLVDPDVVEEKNLNRILNSGKEDAYLSRPKVHVLASAIARMGLRTEVTVIHGNLATREAVLAVAECDVVFGCMDGAEGRHLLNRLATFYLLPYFDVGVRLDADGSGGIDSIVGAVHYIQPGRSSLLSREVITSARIEAEEMKRTDPELYARRIKEGYLRGVDEDRPAVISVNTLYASLCVNEFLARVHPYRNNSNATYATVVVNLGEMQFLPEPEGSVCKALVKYLGKGDVEPLLARSSLS